MPWNQNGIRIECLDFLGFFAPQTLFPEGMYDLYLGDGEFCPSSNPQSSDLQPLVIGSIRAN